MTKKVITAGRPKGPYSPAIVAGNHCYVSGLGGFDPVSGQLVPGGVAAETDVALTTARTVLGQAGYTLDDVVSVTCYLRDIDDWSAMNKVWSTYFVQDPPSRAAVAVADLPVGANIEFTFIAWREH